MANVTLELELPEIPNFVRIIGAEDYALVDVAHIPEVELKKLGHEWTAQLIEHARARAASLHRNSD